MSDLICYEGGHCGICLKDNLRVVSFGFGDYDIEICEECLISMIHCIKGVN